MEYKDMLKIDIMLIKTNTEAENLIDDILISDKNDILRFINIIKYRQHNSKNLEESRKCSKILTVNQELKNIINENKDLSFGLNEELYIPDIVETSEKFHFNIGVKKYKCLAQFEDDFEIIYIVLNSRNVFEKFGSIKKSNLVRYIYPLIEENDDYFKKLLELKIGDKANILAHLENGFIKKTFKKTEVNVTYDYEISIKNNRGVYTDTLGGVSKLLKSEILIEDYSKVTSNQNISKDIDITVKEYDELFFAAESNQDYVIIGTEHKKSLKTLLLDTKPTTLFLEINNSETEMSSNGKISIITLDDFLNNFKQLELNIDSYLIRKFDSNILLSVSDKYNNIDIKKIKTKYLYDDENISATLNIDGEFLVEKITNELLVKLF